MCGCESHFDKNALCSCDCPAHDERAKDGPACDRFNRRLVESAARPAPAAAEGTDELREALALADRAVDAWWRSPGGGRGVEALRQAIAGEVAPLLAKVQAEAGAALIAAERRRQVEQEGWTAEHDAHHSGESLALAACCYAVPPQMRKYRPVSVAIEGGVAVQTVPTLWPWAPGYWKPTADDRVRELVKAGALIAAEIDRLRATLNGEFRG